jgi:hypothetical protein
VRLAVDGMVNAVRPAFEVRRGETRPNAAASPLAAAASLELVVELP